MKKLFLAYGVSLCAFGGLLAASYKHFKNVDSYACTPFVPPTWEKEKASALYAMIKGKDKVLLYSISPSKEGGATDVYIAEAKNDPAAPDILTMHYLLIDPVDNGRMRMASCAYPDGACETVAAAAGFNDAFVIEATTTFTEEAQILTRTFSTAYYPADTSQHVSQADGHEASLAIAMHESGRRMVEAVKDGAAITDPSGFPPNGYLPTLPGGRNSLARPSLNGIELRPGGRL